MRQWALAWKNVWRNRRRSLVTIGITAVGVAGVLFFGGFALFTYQSLEEFSSRQQGHVLLAHADFFDHEEETPMALGLADWQRLRAELSSDAQVRRVLPRIHFSGLISNGEKSAIFIGEGVDPRYEFTISGPFLEVSDGDALAPGSHPLPEVMLARDLARNLRVGVGSVLTLLSTTRDGALNGLDVRVAGIFATGVPEMDKRKLMVALDTAQALLASKRVSTLSVYLHNLADTRAFQTATAQRYPFLATRNWSDLAFFYHKVRDLYDRIFTVMGSIIIAVVLLAVANTMSMAVMERTREIGTLAALGTLPGRLLANFVMEAAIIGLLGSALGMILAGGATLYLDLFEVMMPPPPGMTNGYPLHIAFSPGLYARTAAIMTAVTMIGAAVAARRGVKKTIVEALAHV